MREGKTRVRERTIEKGSQEAENPRAGPEMRGSSRSPDDISIPGFVPGTREVGWKPVELQPRAADFKQGIGCKAAVCLSAVLSAVTV